MERLFEPRRALGRTGFIASQLGIGDLADRAVPLEECVATARRALDAGLNVIDTAPGYEDGYSEQIVGQAVREHGRRDRVFVIDKIDHKDDPVGPQVEKSLQTLGLDHTDAFVFHGVSDMDLWHRLVAPGGGFDQLAACVAKGQTRFRGISSHHPDVVLAAIASGHCDILMFPIGAGVDERYITECLPRAKAAGVGTVCFKTFSAGKLVAETSGYGAPLRPRPRGKFSSPTTSGGGGTALDTATRLPVERCVHYTLTHAPDVALLGMSFPDEQDAAFAAAQCFTPMTEVELADTRAAAIEAMRGKGPNWWNPDPHQWT
ncbi:MAG: aldo/keto reductase [Planctomycetes bacterium]|jgi:aryl-alcohol dehydrogenase-like predicted oxidoreductase|nr:aldo/keto reductase [Planctomycetota bacterium]